MGWPIQQWPQQGQNNQQAMAQALAQFFQAQMPWGQPQANRMPAQPYGASGAMWGGQFLPQSFEEIASNNAMARKTRAELVNAYAPIEVERMRQASRQQALQAILPMLAASMGNFRPATGFQSTNTAQGVRLA